MITLFKLHLMEILFHMVLSSQGRLLDQFCLLNSSLVENQFACRISTPSRTSSLLHLYASKVGVFRTKYRAQLKLLKNQNVVNSAGNANRQNPKGSSPKRLGFNCWIGLLVHWAVKGVPVQRRTLGLKT